MDTQDAIIIGGGPAGLQAALTLGRMRRRVTLIDSGSYRNAPTGHMQNLIGQDGRAPAELRADARAELARYATVSIIEAQVADVEQVAGGDEAADAFRCVLEDGTALEARRLILATGMRDTLPAIPGIAESFGDRIAHCPYCHGFELADGPIAFLGLSAHTPAQAALVERLASRRLVLLDGAEPEPAARAQLERMGVDLVPQRVLAVRAHAEGLEVELEGQDGADALVLSGMFVTLASAPAAPFAERLSLERSPAGAILVDAFGRTSLPGVSAAGDIAQPRSMPGPMAALGAAIASGLTAASTIDRELAMLDNGMAMPV